MEFKQAIVVRSDLRMSKGKIATQVAHAAVEAVLSITNSNNSVWIKWLNEWRKQGQKKIVLRVESESQLLKLYNEALRQLLPVVLITDAGYTELPPGTRTCIAIGPAPSVEVDKLTAKLKLL